MGPQRPMKPSTEDDEHRSRSGHRSTTSSKPKSTSTPTAATKTSSKPPHSSSSSRQPKLTLELPLRPSAPVAKPLDPRQVQELRDHKARQEDEARRKEEAESTAWMRRTRYDPESGEHRKPKSTGSSSSDSPIRRVETPPEFPANWTAEEKANYERLAREGVKVAVFEQHRLDQEKVIRHKDYMTVAWDGCKNIDIPWHRFKVRPSSSAPVETQIQRRVGYNTSGKEIEVMMNAYPITSFPDKAVYQYEINVLHGDQNETDRRVLRKCWNSETRKAHIPDGIWDGGRICWSLRNFDDWNEIIDFKGDLTRDIKTLATVDEFKRNPAFRMSVIQKRKINLSVINSWLQNRRDLDELVIESLSFLDHLLREWPTKQFAAIKRAFFFDKLGDDEELKQEFYQPLANMGASVYRGIYQAIKPTPQGLILNVDVAHCVFFSRISLMGYMMNVNGWNDMLTLVRNLQSTRDEYGGTKESKWFAQVNKKIQGLRVAPNYEGCPFKMKSFIVKGLIHAKPKEFFIDYYDKATGKSTRIHLEEYFMRRYNIRLEYPNMLLVEMQKEDVHYPAEFLVIKGLQRYRYKLTDAQAAQMIQWCATRPPKRLANARQSKELLQHKNDPILKLYGMKISDQMIKIKARLLPSPELQFGGNRKHNPQHSGSWDLRGKKFYKPNEKALQAWGVGFFSGHRKSISQDQTLSWVEQFVKMYKSMGGEVTGRPVVKGLSEDVGTSVKKLYDAIAAQNKREPQLMIFIVPDKDSWVYLRLKKSSDCRYGTPSQVLQSAHCITNRPQYHANVLMKVNAKLGGITARAVPKSKSSGLRPGSMIIGADVTHPMMGVWTPSLAAMSVSANSTATRYMGGCETNGDRIEIIRDKVVEYILHPMVAEWKATVGGGKAPEYVYYFRDGVSASEYQRVLSEEVPAIRFAIAHACGQAIWAGKMCVVVANKRHHLRAFPDPKNRAAADTHGGPLPGTLIDRDVTSPHDWDFLLYTHIALQGTPRPVHYHVLLDEMGLKPNDLEGMINDHCYQYIRSTTSVSVHPAIYYAHLISVRARHHEDVPITSGPQSGPEVKMTNPKPKEPRAKRLLPIEGTSNKLALGMWYV
ncbi:hypothetical protein HAV15_011480 [Penicillium sp. str. |nr:hypothetical protein HAV15_011480 [Penicillium sp. str. \